MFKDCKKLKAMPTIHIVGKPETACKGMFEGCTALEILDQMDGELKYDGFMDMFKGCSKLKFSETQDETYTNEFLWNVKGVATDAFAGTGGTFTGTPVYGTTYYTSNSISGIVE